MHNKHVSTLKTVAHGASFKERIMAFASLPDATQRFVLDAHPGTIADGALTVLNSVQMVG